ncbi:UPF0182 family protein [Nakamurella flava]|uniref:UPF0182 protein FDO65_07110 n=1 Tax=Nakamurella flava TaxID=2576308 RepID=A0A4U6QMH7_9ACTN|nr:UPF0182 family protein [Nakamurella flava]TKV61358.1 UPF0182 family protein [Nakamurella flava]
MAVRPPAGLPTISKRARRVLIALVALAVAAILWFQFVGIYVDWLWYGEVGYREVFTTQAVSRVVLFLIAGVGAAGLLFLALFLSYRSRPVFVPTNEVDPLAPYRSVVTARPRLFAFGLSGIVGLVCGLSAQSEWATIQLFLNGGDFGTVDPQFGNDVGFYVFRLPLIQLILSWLFVITVICFIAVAVVQYLFGGIRLGGPGRRITSAATLQLSLLVAVFVLLKAVQYWFDRYELLFSNRNPSFTGASYTDVNAVLPAKIILMVIAAICAVGFVAGAITRSVKLPAIALGLLVLSSVLIGGVWPLVLQQVVVNPNGINREPDFIARNIEATRNAYDIRDDEINYVQYPGVLAGNPRDIVGDQTTLPNARLLDPNVLSPTFTQQQQLRNFYGFPDQLAMDRYPVTDSSGNQQTQDFVVALRELDAQNLNDGQRDWINQHFVYTHGDGFIAAPANQAPNGYPNYVVSDLASINAEGQSTSSIPVTQPRTYYGQLVPPYAIVGADGGQPREYDTDSSSYTYTGSGGVSVGNLFQRLVFATQYGEQNFLFSGEINANSKILYNRDPIDRVKKAAPFLTPDTKAYPAVVDGRIVWIVDAYTTATNYPYAQTVTLSDATNNSLSARGAAGQAATQVSYIRNSVKATVDAYDGTVSLYGIDQQDPVLKAWEGVFPGLIKAKSDVSADLQAHFRYPQDLFEVQRSLLVKYNVDNPVEFFQNSGFWRVPDDPTVSDTVKAPQPPYYLQVQLPGAQNASFQLTSVLTGFQREFMSAYVSASSDPADYGKITVLRLPTNTQTPGPAQVQQLFRTTQEVSSLVTLSQQQGGSRVIFGNLLTLPVNDGLLYVEPFYIQGQASSTSSYPQLNKVLVWYAGRVGVGNTLVQALNQATPVETPDGDGTTPIPSNGTTLTQNSSSASPTSQAALPANLQDALQAMDQAESALQAASTSGDLVRVGQATQDLQNAVNNYLSLASAATQTPAASTAPSG